MRASERKCRKARLTEYEADVERLEKQYQELHYMTERLKAARDFESLKEESRILCKPFRRGKRAWKGQ